MKHSRLIGLVAATHTPFTLEGQLNLPVVERQAQYLLCSGIQTVFISGTTGEGHSLEPTEQSRLLERWMQVTSETSLKVVVHVGFNSLASAQNLATQAEELGASAISALAPTYSKPENLTALIEWCAAIAASAPETPFYYYDIPALTAVRFPMSEFLDQASDRIPTLRGIKFTNPDLAAYQFCLRLDDGAFDIPFGMDEQLLGAWALGARGAVGSSYNFAAPIYQKLIRCFEAGQVAEAREHQFRSARLIQSLGKYGYLSATKAVMEMLGVNVGPSRTPNKSFGPTQVANLRADLERLGFFDWLSLPSALPERSSSHVKLEHLPE